MNIKRYNLINTETVGYNPETGQLMINPNYLFDIVDFLSSKNVKKYYSYVNGLDMMDDSNCKGVIKKAIKDFDKIICEI